MALAPQCKRQEMMLKSDAQILVLGGAVGGMKVQPYSSDIYTPWGIKKMGDLEIGSIISSPTGSPQKVLQVYEQGIIDVYRCEFDDGSSCEVGLDHLWLIKKTGSHKTKRNNFYSGYFSEGVITTTKDIISFLKRKEDAPENSYIKSQNIIIPICDPIKFNLNKILTPIHPYLLGILLGDGCFKLSTPTLTCFDEEIIKRIESFGYKVQKRSVDGCYSFLQDTGIAQALKDLNLQDVGLKHKFIPHTYKYLPVEQRFELIKGLMDSDGTVDSRGHLSFSSISKQLALDVQWVLRSLGCNVTMTNATPVCTNSATGRKVCDKSYVLYIKPKGDRSKFFSLKRKKDKCKNILFNGDIFEIGKRFKKIIFVRKEKGRCIVVSDPSRLYITNDFIVTHNTFSMCMIPLRYVDCPHFNGIIFRRTTVQVKGQGGLWDTANDIFSMLPKPHRPSVRNYDLTATWKNGAKLKFSHMEYTKDKYNHQGLQYTFIGFDEGTQFEWEQVEYLMSRMRSKSKYPSRMIISTNPSPDSWLYNLVEWYLDEEGYPDESKTGVIRYFIRKNGEFIWSNDKQKLIDEHSTKYKKVRPISFSFISSNVYHNKILLKNNPEYVDWLEGLNEIERQRLLYGNWKIRPEGANYFKREDLQKADAVPKGAICCRAYDKAGTAPSDVNKYPDRTASIKMYRTNNGEFFITGEYHHSFFDVREPDVFGRFAYRPGKRDNIILNQAKYDGEYCDIIMPIDPGSAGVTEYQESAKKLALEGFRVRKDPVPAQRSKLQRFMPFSAAVENGNVYIVESTFPNKATLEAYYKELEAFDGKRSGKLRKDDWADCTASAYNYLSKARNARIVCRNQLVDNTLAKKVLEHR